METGGGGSNGHGMVLVMHMMKQLKSSQKLSELLTWKYDSICSWLHCLKPFHEQFTVSVCRRYRAAFACTTACIQTNTAMSLRLVTVTDTSACMQYL